MSRPVAAVSLVLLLVLAAYLLGAGAGTGLVSTVVDALPRLLTEPRPLARRPDLLVAPVLLAGLTGLLTGLHLKAPTRMAPVAGGLVLYVAGLLLTSGTADRHGVLAAALLLGTSVAGWILLDSDQQTPGTASGARVLWWWSAPASSTPPPWSRWPTRSNPATMSNRRC